MLNCAIIMGRLTADPQLRKTASDVSVTSFTVAVDRNGKVAEGQERQADFISVTAWRGAADFVARYFHKGDMIAVQGSIQTRSYEDKNGNKRTATEIVADNVSFCGGRNGGGQQTTQTPTPAPQTSQAPTQEFAPANEFPGFGADGADDGMPF